ncbi:MAG: ankyrin repeat domain-containing protein [Flavobacterium sp.]
MKKYFLIIFLIASTSIFSQATIFDVARKGTVTEMNAILSNAPELIDSLTPQGFTPLILACYNGNVAVATFLVQQKANVNFNSSNGTALMAAIVKNDKAMASLLLEAKTNVDLQDGNGFTALHYAIQFRNYEMIALLLQFQTNPNIKDNSGMSATDYALKLKDEQIQQLLKL